MLHLGRYVSIVSAAGVPGGGGFTDDSGGEIPVDSWQYALMTWAITQAFFLIRATRDDNSAVVNADIQWPDAVHGVLTVDKASDFPGVVDAWSATYIGPNGTYKISQPAVTRDINGAIINQPPITIGAV